MSPLDERALAEAQAEVTAGRMSLMEASCLYDALTWENTNKEAGMKQGPEGKRPSDPAAVLWMCHVCRFVGWRGSYTPHLCTKE